MGVVGADIVLQQKALAVACCGSVEPPVVEEACHGIKFFDIRLPIMGAILTARCDTALSNWRSPTLRPVHEGMPRPQPARQPAWRPDLNAAGATHWSRTA